MPAAKPSARSPKTTAQIAVLKAGRRRPTPMEDFRLVQESYALPSLDERATPEQLEGLAARTQHVEQRLS